MQITVNGYGTDDKYDKILKAIVGDDTSNLTMIDLCCCYAPFTRRLDFFSKVFVDIIDRGITPDLGEFYLADVLGNHEAVSKKKYDMCFAMDAIEHFSKENGYKLLERMNDLSTKKTVLFTPLGDLMVSDDNDDPDTHKSGWLPEDVAGYATVVCPEWHKEAYGKGAFFFWKTDNIDQDFKRVKDILEHDGVASCA